jgi:transposase
MAKFKAYHPGSDYSVVINVSDFLPEDHLCKRIEKIVSGLDTRAIESNFQDVGQNALHPKLLLSVIFYGYAVGIRSGRKLAQACQEQLPFIYLSKSYHPKKSCINDFRKNHYQHFSGLFIEVLKKCRQAGLADASLSIVDGSKQEANSAKRRTKNKEQYEKWRQTLLEDIADLEKEESDSAEQKKN